MISVKNPAGEVAYYDYNLGGQVKTRKLGNHALVYYTYDPARRVTRIQHRTSGLTELATLNYQYDHVGNPVSIIREDRSATYFSYDSVYQLTAETQLDCGRQPHLPGRIPVRRRPQPDGQGDRRGAIVLHL